MHELDEYGWRLTDIENGKIVEGPCDVSDGMLAILDKDSLAWNLDKDFYPCDGFYATFRLLSDDNDVYAIGRMTGEFAGFEPLDDYGIAYYGASKIEYLQANNKWEMI